ncbi:MAG: L-aspartate oxidase [Syntrophorhabdus sp. PtaU1.Bin050]|nr:MAG: L-aspartate oxidase [Syntrophorhabdus sp. PtaU1.Bin050]
MQDCIEKVNTDVLVIGSGGAGALAALRVSDNGVKVMVVTKENIRVGGATVMAAGGISIPYGEGDSPEIFYNDILRGGEYLNDPRLARILAEGARHSFIDLENYGVVLDRAAPESYRILIHSEGHTIRRAYMDRREGLGVCQAIGRAMIQRRIEFLPETIITQLLVAENTVFGAVGYCFSTGKIFVITAKTVILSTGGIGQLYDMTTNGKSLTGDGIYLGYEAGADLMEMEMVQFLPLTFPYPAGFRGIIIGMSSLFGPGVRLLNRMGERFMERYDPERKEFVTRDLAARANYMEIMNGRGTVNSAIWVDPTRNEKEIMEQHKASLPHVFRMIEKVFGPEAANWEKPFEAAPAQHFFMGGLRIDTCGETSVKNLFAVGECSAGVHGANRLSGNALTEIYVFGGHVGLKAAERTKDVKSRTTPDGLSDEAIADLLEHGRCSSQCSLPRPHEIIARLKQVMEKCMGPVRDGKALERGAEQIRELRDVYNEGVCLLPLDSLYNLDIVRSFELRSMLILADLMIKAASIRKESRGSHFRSDFPDKDREWQKNIILRRGHDGEVKIQLGVPGQ